MTVDVALLSVPDPNYVAQLVVNGIGLAGLYILLSVGLTLIFGVMHILNLAHGDLMIIGAYATVVFAGMVPFHPLLLLPLIMVLGFVAGAALQKAAFEPVLDDPVINQLLLSFGIAISIQGVLGYFFGVSSKSVNLEPGAIGSSLIRFGGMWIQEIRVIMLVLSAVLLCLLWVLLYKTKTGLQIRATAQDNTAARVVGINIERTYVIVMGIGSALAMAAGLMLAMYTSFGPFAGIEWVLIGLVIVAVGGLGSLKGAVVAGLLMALIEQLGTIYMSSSMAKAALFLIFLGVILVRPRGMFGSISHGQGLYD